MGVSGQHHAPAALYSRGKDPRYPPSENNKRMLGFRVMFRYLHIIDISEGQGDGSINMDLQETRFVNQMWTELAEENPQ
jgi:hypothetical protein